MSKGFASNPRIFLLAGIVLLGFGGLGARLVALHVLDRDKLLPYVEKARRREDVQRARRGDILDTRGNILAISRTQMELGVDPHWLRAEDREKWPELAALIGVPLNELTRVFETKVRKVPVVRPALASGAGVAGEDLAAMPAAPVGHAGDAVDLQTPLPRFAEATGGKTAAAFDDEVDSEGYQTIRWAKLKDHVDEAVYDRVMALKIRGVYGTRSFGRVYPNNRLAAHVIGFVNKEGVAASGVERYADFYLRGHNGWVESERDGGGRELAQFRTREVPASDGYSVVLSLDAVVQHMVEEELERIAAEYNPKKASIIVSDPRTGFILALGNYPSFNLNEFGSAPLDVQRNFAITDQFDPGSTFKIVPAAGALNEGLVTPTTRFDCSISSIEYRGRTRNFITDSYRAQYPMPVTEIISRSSNVGAALLAMTLGDEKLYEYARAFGFGTRTGFPFGGEIPGTLTPPEKWFGTDITRIPAGYSVPATAMQIHYAMATIASGGNLMRPQIIRQIRDASGEIVYRYEGVAKHRVISVETAEAMAQMLQKVVVKGEGTAAAAAIPGFEVAGKTGTAQKLLPVVDERGGTVMRYSPHHHVGSFVGFFPASRPQIAITVIIDEANTRGTAAGGLVAAPSFKRLGEQLIPYLDIKPVFEPGRAQLVMEGGRR